MSSIPGAEGRSEILPRWLRGRGGASVVRRDAASTERRISMSKSAKKRLSSVIRRALRVQQNPRNRPRSTPKGKNAEPGSKQSRVIAMLQSPAGATIAAMMQATGWQQHSVRGFLAGVVRKRLKLKLGSKKVDGTRVYRVADRRQRQDRRSPLQAPVVLSAPCRASGSVLPCRTANHSTPRLRACAISGSVSFAAVGTPCSGGSRPLTCPAICCFASWPTGCRPISWVTWTSRPYACSIARGLPRRPDSVP